jgi:hypothetical protein
MRKGLLVFLSTVLVMSALATAETVRIPLSASQTSLELLSDRGGALSFRAEISSIEAMEVATPEGLFTQLNIPGFHQSMVVGAPELPQMNRLFEIPFGAATRVEIHSSRTTSLSLADFGMEHRVMPAQPSMPKNVDPADWLFVYDASAYSLDRVAYDLVKTTAQGRLRAVDLGLLELAPVEYLPENGELLIHDMIEFTLHFEGGDDMAGDQLKASTHSPFFSHLYENIEGYRGLHDSYPDLVRDVVTLAIVVPEAFEIQIQDFVDWKIQRGFNVVVGVIGSPEVGSTTSTIQAWVHDLYNNGTPHEPAPSFVIFIGDVAQCPTFQVSGDASDRPYCDVEGDLVPDIYYGRFSATNPSQLQAILDKTMMYDQFTMPDPSYLGEVVMIAGMDSSYGPSHGNGQINYGTEHYFNAAHGIYSHTYLYPASGSNASNIVQNVSDGVGYINYTAHGSQTSWSDPSFTQSNINGLSNYGEYCLAVGNCCLTSTYDYGECFAETWLRAADKGAIGYIGGSNSTYWNEDYWWGVGYHSSSQINGTAWPYESTELGVYDGLFHDHEEAMDQWYVTNDAIIFCGNLAVMESGSSLSTYYWNIYNLMGDPSISTYLGVPGSNPVVHDGFISGAATEFTMEAAPGSYVGLTQGGDLAGAGTVGANGVTDIEVWNIDPTGGDLSIVVMMQNYEPYMTTIPVGYVEQPSIVVTENSFEVQLSVGGTDMQDFGIGNEGEAGSTLVYDISIIDPSIPRSDRSVAGSTLTPSPGNYTPGTTETFTLTLYNASTDTEWISEVTLDFDLGVNVVSSTNFVGGSDGDLVTNNATGDGALLVWSDPDGGWGQVHGGESVSCQVTLDISPNVMGDLEIPFSIQGDIYGSDPHYIEGNMLLVGPTGPSITIIAPNGGELWPIGESRIIQWSWTDVIATVDIELSRDGGFTWEMLADDTANTGSFMWTVTGPFVPYNQIRILAQSEGVSDFSDAPFCIYQPLTWIAMPVMAGDCAMGEYDYLDINFNCVGLSPGDYPANIVIAHNAPGDDVILPVTLHVLSGGTGAGDIPAMLLLKGNYPNPFNPKTTIRFAIPSAKDVKLEIFDVNGRRVAMLLDGNMDAGEHHVVWDGRDNAGKVLPSGLYFYKLNTGTEQRTSKMLMLK